MTILTGDYNTKHNSWYTEDNTDKYGTAIHELFAKHNILQTVNEPTNITSRTQHCIDLVATDQPNIIIKNEVAPSLHTNCSHQVNLVKLDLKCPPPPPFKRVVWHYARANTNSLLECLHQFDWRHQLSLKADNPLDQVNLLDETLLNAASNFIPNNEKTFVPRDPPGFLITVRPSTKSITESIPVLSKGVSDLTINNKLTTSETSTHY